MREVIPWQEVPCGACGEQILKHKAQFAPTGLAHDYRCWACAAKENSPNLQREERQSQALFFAACLAPHEDPIHPTMRALFPIVGASVFKFLVVVFGSL